MTGLMVLDKSMTSPKEDDNDNEFVSGISIRVAQGPELADVFRIDLLLRSEPVGGGEPLLDFGEPVPQAGRERSARAHEAPRLARIGREVEDPELSFRVPEDLLLPVKERGDLEEPLPAGVGGLLLREHRALVGLE